MLAAPEAWLLSRPLVVAAAWMVLYAGDYYMTLWGARLSRSQAVIRYSGSYELTPEYQDDVDRQRMLSVTFLAWLVAGAVMLYGTGVLWRDLPVIYGLLVGFTVLVEIPVFVRHLTNVWMFSRLARPCSGAEGFVTYSQAFSYRLSSVQLMLTAVMFLSVFALTLSPTVAGAACRLVLLASDHARRAAVHVSESDA